MNNSNCELRWWKGEKKRISNEKNHEKSGDNEAINNDFENILFNANSKGKTQRN